jgi:hypothetical protein
MPRWEGEKKRRWEGQRKKVIRKVLGSELLETTKLYEKRLL